MRRAPGQGLHPIALQSLLQRLLSTFHSVIKNTPNQFGLERERESCFPSLSVCFSSRARGSSQELRPAAGQPAVRRRVLRAPPRPRAGPRPRPAPPAGRGPQSQGDGGPRPRPAPPTVWGTQSPGDGVGPAVRGRDPRRAVFYCVGFAFWVVALFLLVEMNMNQTARMLRECTEGVQCLL